jgi:hypothetical protein
LIWSITFDGIRAFAPPNSSNKLLLIGVAGNGQSKMRAQRSCGPAALLLLAFTGVVQARGYVSYSYQGIDVMAGDPGYARTLAHNVHRLDEAARKLLEWDAGALLPPTHVYALHEADFAKLVPPGRIVHRFHMVTTVASAFAIHDGENYAFVNAAAATDYSGAYFGLAGSILLSEDLHYPAWFSTGFERMIAPTQIRESKVTIGRVDPWLAKVVQSWKLRFIPTRLLFTIRPDDPMLRDDLMQEKLHLSAGCWST